MNPIKTCILILTVTVLFSACSSNKAQTKKYFRLNEAPPTQSTEIKPMTLVVKRPSALSILGGRPIVATQTDNSLVQLSHNFWLESPKVLLQDQIKQWAKNHWQTISDQTPPNTKHHVLNTRILAFEKKQNQAVATLEFFLNDQNNQLLFNQKFNVTENITEDNYQAFAQAMSRAIDTIFNQLSSQLKGQL